MPFRSEAQRKFLHANHPSLARKWESKYGSAAANRKGKSPKRKGFLSKVAEGYRGQ